MQQAVSKPTEQDRAMAGETMTATEAGEALGVGPRRVRALIDAGQLVATRHGQRLWIVDRASVEALVAKSRPRDGGRPTKDRRSAPASAEVALTREEVEGAREAAMRGLPLVDTGGAVVSPQIVAFAAGLAAARARRGVYRAGDGADVSVDGGAYRIRLYGGTGAG